MQKTSAITRIITTTNFTGLIYILVNLLLFTNCQSQNHTEDKEENKPIATKLSILMGADQMDILLPKLTNKQVGLVVNQSSRVNGSHLADTLKSLGVSLINIMSPEHGFRGTADAGEHLKNGMDSKLGIPILSLYGKTKKPTPEYLAGLDVIVFDIQDVGVRYFTYISTMHYVMEACAENGKKLIVLDRPNPNGSYIDGPILDTAFRSFVGMHPVPIVHGMTVGEYAQMINGERWLFGGIQCNLEVIPLKNWNHRTPYSLPIKPSPNLPNDQAIKLYPSLCLFEGTVISMGRGTPFPFQVLGHPKLTHMPFSFTPISIEGMSKNPPFQNQQCFGIDLREVPTPESVSLKFLIDFYHAYPEKENFFNTFFNKLAGNNQLQHQIKQGKTENEIRDSWKAGLEKYDIMRQSYLLYP